MRISFSVSTTELSNHTDFAMGILGMKGKKVQNDDRYVGNQTVEFA